MGCGCNKKNKAATNKNSNKLKETIEKGIAENPGGAVNIIAGRNKD